MSVKDQILLVAKNNNGLITSKKLDQLGIARSNLSYLCKTNQLVRVSRGVYALPEAWEDQLFNLQVRFSKGIYSGETVLYLAGLTDRTPLKHTMVFPVNYNLKNAKLLGVNCFQENKVYYADGITYYKTAQGNQVKGYVIEKVLCDILKPRYSIDIQVISDAFKIYTRHSQKNIPLLSSYAKKAQVAEKVSTYLEVLL